MERSKNRSIDRHRKRPAANTSSLITAKRAGVLALVGLGLFGSYKLSESEPTEDFKRPVAEKTEKGQEEAHLPLSDLSPDVSTEDDFSDKKRKWKLYVAIFLKAMKEAEENRKYHLTAKGVIDPQAYSDYLEALVEENRNDFPREAKRVEVAMGYLLDDDTGLLDQNEIAIADWRNITEMFDNFDENNFGDSAEEISKYFIAMSPTFGARSHIIYALEDGRISEDDATSLFLLTEDIEHRDEISATVEQELETHK